MKPTKGNVLIRPIEEESLLELPEDAKLKPMTGEVLAICDNSELFTGANVIYKKYAADEVDINGEKLLVVREEDILLIL
jgi:chaperonin GroES